MLLEQYACGRLSSNIESLAYGVNQFGVRVGMTPGGYAGLRGR